MWDTHSFDHQSRQKWVSQIDTRDKSGCPRFTPEKPDWRARHIPQDGYPTFFSLLWRNTARAIGGGPLTVVLGVGTSRV